MKNLQTSSECSKGQELKNGDLSKEETTCSLLSLSSLGLSSTQLLFNLYK